MYAGAPEAFVGPVFEAFEQATSIDIAVRYGGSEALVALILEEGDLSPADAFFTLDAGALATLSSRGLFRQLPASILDRVEARFRSPEGLWVGVTGRARVLLYSTENVTAGELPTNGAFQPFVTAMLITVGEERTRAWLEGMIANGVRDFPNNISQVHAVGRGEIDLVLVNHYYLYLLLAEHGGVFPARNHIPPTRTSGRSSTSPGPASSGRAASRVQPRT